MTTESDRSTELPRHTPTRFQILALNGGGAKALFSAHILDCLEQDTGVRIRDTFDLIAGTSAGGVIALALGAGMTPREIKEHYEDLIPKVFPRRRLSRARQPFKPTYPSGPLRHTLERIFGTRTLADSDIPLVIPSWNPDARSVHVFKTPHHPRLKRDWRHSMVDVAMATTAAPTYFPAAQVGNMRLIDGGVWANNPSTVAVAEALSLLDIDITAIRVLNVGTTAPVKKHASRLHAGGLVTWATSAPETLLAASTTGAAGTAEHLLSRDRFLRIDAPVPDKLFRLDRVEPAQLMGLAETHSRHNSEAFAETFGGHTRYAYQPLHRVSEVST